MFMNFFSKKLPFILIALGVCGFAVKSIFIKIAFEQGLSPTQVMGLRMIFAMPFFILAWIISRIISKDNKSSFKFKGVFICSCLYFLSSQADISGLKFVSVGMERILLFTIPLFVIFISSIFFKKKYHYIIYILAIVSWVGVVISFFGEQTMQNSLTSSDKIRGILLVLISAILYAAYYIFSAEEIKKTGFISFNSQVMVVSCIFSLIPLFINSDIKYLMSIPFEKLEFPFYLAVISTVLPSFFMLYGIKKCGPTFVSFCNNASPFFTMLVGYFFINERFTMQEFIGLFLVMLSIFYVQKYKEIK